MTRAFDHVSGRSKLDDFAEVHDGDPIRDVFNHRKIVGDEDEREVHLSTKLREQVENLRLNRNIEGGHGFVGYEDFRFERERPGNRDALALSAGEFMRVLPHQTGGETNQTHEVRHACRDLGRRTDSVHLERFSERRVHRHSRIQRCVRILKNHLQVTPHHEHFGR